MQASVFLGGNVTGDDPTITDGILFEGGTLGASFGAVITNAYGLKLPAITAGGTNWAIYSAGGDSAHAGQMKFGATTVPSEDVHAADTVRADTAFNLNGTEGVSCTLELDDGSTEKITLVFTGGILTSRTVAATTGSALADWTD
jgi:hypothetical protein